MWQTSFRWRPCWKKKSSPGFTDMVSKVLDGVFPGAHRPPGRFSITCGKDAGHLMEFGAGMLLGLRRYLEPTNSWNFTILSSSALLCVLPLSSISLSSLCLLRPCSGCNTVHMQLPNTKITCLAAWKGKRALPPPGAPVSAWCFLLTQPFKCLPTMWRLHHKCQDQSTGYRGGGIMSGHSEPVHTPHRCWW